jgi:hypothetical protein
MKTAEEILMNHTKEYFAMNTNLFVAKNDILNAMKEFAEQQVNNLDKADVSNSYSGWIAVKDQKPTKADGDVNGMILVINEDTEEQEILDYDAIAIYAELYKYVTHWRRLPVFRV